MGEIEDFMGTSADRRELFWGLDFTVHTELWFDGSPLGNLSGLL